MAAILRDSHRRRPAYAPTSNTTNYDNHEKINSGVSFTFLYGARFRLATLWKTLNLDHSQCFLTKYETWSHNQMSPWQQVFYHNIQ